MSFLTPLFLLGALAVAIPIILHLINFRKPNKQPFSTLVFFQQLQKSSIRWLRIKKLILLALRIAAFLFLAFALARPFLTPNFSFFAPDSGSVLHAVLIENGPAMDQIDERGPVMETALSALETLIKNGNQNDRYLIFNTHGPVLFPEEISRGQAERVINEIESQNAGNFTAERLTQLISRAAATDRDATGVFIITRGSETLTKLSDDFKEPDSFNPALFPLTVIQTGETPVANTAITDIEVPNQIIAGGRPFTVTVTVQNFSETRAINHFLSLEINEQIEGQYQVELNPNETRSFTFEAIAPEKGAVKGRAILEGDVYAFDNIRYFTVQVPDITHILLVNEPQQSGKRNSWLMPVFEAAGRSAGQVSVTQVNWDTFDSRFPDEDYHAIILEGVKTIPEFAWNSLLNFTQSGGGLIIIPGDGSNPDQFNPFLNRTNSGQYTGLMGDPGSYEAVARVDQIVRGHPIFDDMFDISDDETVRLDLPVLYHYWKYQPVEGVAAQVIMQTNLGDPLLVQQRFGNGRLLISTTSPDPAWSAFAIHPIFAPLYYRIGMYASAGETGGLNEFSLGQTFEWNVSGQNRTVEIQLNDLSLIPEIRAQNQGTKISSETYEWQPGWAALITDTDTVHVAINQNISESSFSTLNTNELDDIFNSVFNVNDVVSLQGISENDIAGSVGIAGAGREIWNWFIITAILLLIAESIVAKKLKGGGIG